MENIKVYIRLKPTKDNPQSSFSFDTKTITNTKTNEVFTFDSVISPEQTNKDIFENLIKQNLTSLLKGINISIFAYGQTSTGKTFTMKGESKSNEGLIPLCIKEIFNSLNSPESNITKSLVKVSYSEIYNETVNDLIDTNKKNLEIRESPNKGIFVNNLSEIVVTNVEKAMQILNKGENNRIIAETKLNEKSSRSHTIFKINIEFNIKEKKYFSQLNLVDLAGSENVSKAKCEGMRIKEGGNINKSLLALSNVINKLSQNNNKNFVNYRDSKLTRLLQTALGGNSKTTIICTMIDDNNHYSETLNTLHFGIKAKNIKTTVKENEILNDQKKISMENQALRNKIKMLEKLIQDKKQIKENKKNNIHMTANKNNNKTFSNNKKYLLSTNTKNKNDINNNNNNSNEQISNLEKEVSMLKKYLMNNEELISDIGSVQGNQDWINTQGDIYNNMCNISAYKPSLTQRISNLSALRGSGSAIKSNYYFNSPVLPRQHQSEFYTNSNMNQIEAFNTNNNNNININNFKRNLCLTEMRLPINNNTNKNYFHSAIRKTAPQNNNFIFGSNSKFPLPDLNLNLNNNSTNYDNITNNDVLIKENEELKKNLYELKKTYQDVVQSKEQQISLLNQNHDMTLENCEKLIKEAETNYLNLKKDYEQILEKMKSKESELDEMKQKNLNQDSSLNYYKTELSEMKELNYASDIEAKYNTLLEENVKLKQKEEEETSKLKEENITLKKNIENIDNKYKEKCKELNENQKKNNDDKKSIEKELQKCKQELKTYKNNLNKKPTKNNNTNNITNEKIKDYEEQINKLIEENTQYKTNIEKIEKTQIVEYQKLLDDCFAKITQLTQELKDSKDKNKYLETALNIVETKSINDKLIFSPPLSNNNNALELNEKNENKIENKTKSVKTNISNGRKELSNGEKDFLNKKRKLPYQSRGGENKNSGIIQTPNKENNNTLNQEFSNFEI